MPHSRPWLAYLEQEGRRRDGLWLSQRNDAALQAVQDVPPPVSPRIQQAIPLQHTCQSGARSSQWWPAAPARGRSPPRTAEWQGRRGERAQGEGYLGRQHASRGVRGSHHLAATRVHCGAVAGCTVLLLLAVAVAAAGLRRLDSCLRRFDHGRCVVDPKMCHCLCPIAWHGKTAVLSMHVQLLSGGWLTRICARDPADELFKLLRPPATCSPISPSPGASAATHVLQALVQGLDLQKGTR